MNKFEIVKKLRNNGDSIVTLRGLEDGKLVTIDFNQKYIKSRKSKRFTIQKDSILLYSWTDDKFEHIKIRDFRTITPLSAVLKNQSPEIVIDG